MPSIKLPRLPQPSGQHVRAPVKARKRMAPEEREHQIVKAAIEFFAEHGFGASTRDLARELRIAQPLLFRYFPTKELLIERVYDEVFMRRWNPGWEELLADRSLPLIERLKRYLKDYARFVLQDTWVRIFIFSGLSQGGVNQKYLARLRERHLRLIARELRHEYGLSDPPDAEAEEEEIELVWAMHSSVFYFGVRKWIYGLAVPRRLDRLIDMRVEAFLFGAPAVLRASR